MNEPEESLELIEDGRDFRLVRVDAGGLRSEIFLTEANVAFLSQLSQKMLQQIVARRSTSAMTSRGVSPLMAVPVVRVQLGTDLHQSQILLKIFDDFGNESGFSFPVEVASALADALPRHLARVKPPVKQ